ncbi:MAG: hypothetical protein H0U16_00390 [Actinobacteria bacterium]|nr:hypothetical protein [Actinomycetota bacterium]
MRSLGFLGRGATKVRGDKMRSKPSLLLVGASVLVIVGVLPAVGAPPGPCFGREPTIVGTNGNDTLIGTPGNDVIQGRAGMDTIRGLAGNDRLCGGQRERFGAGASAMVGMTTCCTAVRETTPWTGPGRSTSYSVGRAMTS